MLVPRAIFITELSAVKVLSFLLIIKKKRPSQSLENVCQPRSQGLSSYRPLEREKKDPGRVWSRATWTVENIREGSSVIGNLSR